MSKQFDFKEFTNLDNSSDADYLIHSMDIMYSLDSIRKIKSNAIAALSLKKGDYALEAGCGHGEDAESMAILVGDSGHVLAIDNSNRMLTEAKQRSTCNNIEYRLGEIQHISCADNTFDACHADRLLVGHKDYKDIFHELLRVIKPHGRISISDVDAISIAIHPFNKITAAILKQLHSCFINAAMGRQLLELFSQFNLKNIQLIPEISIIRDFATLQKIFNFKNITADAIKNNLITADESELWFEQINEANVKNYFLYSIMIFTVVGEK